MANKFFYLILFVSFLICCSTDYREANDKAVEKLHSQIVEGKYEEIYDQSSDIGKAKISKTEFVEKMSFAVKSMKNVDESLDWQKSESEENFYNDHPVTENSYRQLMKDDKKIGVFIYWTNFKLCGFETSSSEKDSEIRVVQGCS